jgi:hypothetical protein
MKSTPAEVKAASETSDASVPKIPAKLAKIVAAKCSAINTHPVSQCRDAVV